MVLSDFLFTCALWLIYPFKTKHYSEELINVIVGYYLLWVFPDIVG